MSRKPIVEVDELISEGIICQNCGNYLSKKTGCETSCPICLVEIETAKGQESPSWLYTMRKDKEEK